MQFRNDAFLMVKNMLRQLKIMKRFCGRKLYQNAFCFIRKPLIRGQKRLVSKRMT